MKQWGPSLFFRACRLLLRMQIILGLIIFCYNCFFQGYLGVMVLVYFGWLVGLAGLVFFILGSYELQKMGKSAEGMSFLLTTVLIDGGIYEVIRHPEYLGSILLVFGSILISQNWFTLVLGVLLLSWFFGYVLPEEDRHLIEKFGDDYKRYMQKVPRINLLLGIIRLLRKKRAGKVEREVKF